MPTLYRSSFDPDHWFVPISGADWVRFPAREAGWSKRRPVTVRDAQSLKPVPLWMAFNTGLLEAIRLAEAGRAA